VNRRISNLERDALEKKLFLSITFPMTWPVKELAVSQFSRAWPANLID
jgi:hypothetical protein